MKPVESAGRAAARLDLYSLDDAVQVLFSASLAASTQLVYRSGAGTFSSSVKPTWYSPVRSHGKYLVSIRGSPPQWVTGPGKC